MPLSTAVQEFLDQFSQMLETEGLPRASGRILGLLFVEGGELTAEDFVTKLTLSRGSVSTAMKTLEMMGMVQRTKKPGDRSERFRLHSEPFIPMLQAGVIRARRMRNMANECRTKLPKETQNARSRLKELETFFEFAADSLEKTQENYVKKISSRRNR